MSDETLTLVIRTHDSSRIADVTVPADMTGEQLLQTCMERWKLPSDRDYSLQCERTGRQIPHREPLAASGLKDGDELVLYPLLEAGAGRPAPGRRP